MNPNIEAVIKKFDELERQCKFNIESGEKYKDYNLIKRNKEKLDLLYEIKDAFLKNKFTF